MRIVIIATGNRGDVEPYVALGVGLKKRVITSAWSTIPTLLI